MGIDCTILETRNNNILLYSFYGIVQIAYNYQILYLFQYLIIVVIRYWNKYNRYYLSNNWNKFGVNLFQYQQSLNCSRNSKWECCRCHEDGQGFKILRRKYFIFCKNQHIGSNFIDRHLCLTINVFIFLFWVIVISPWY